MLYLKALHIIFVVTWFAALFYIVRLFIYHKEELEKKDSSQVLCNQFKLMEKRLWYGIGWPSLVLTYIFGFSLVYVLNYWTMDWMLLKFGFVLLLTIYHIICHNMVKGLQNDRITLSSQQLRYWNELATLFLFGIVFTIVLKNSVGIGSLIIGSIGFGVFIMAMVYLAMKKRNKKL